MPIITLISDWGTKDYYLSAVKGHILKLLPEATIVDISHEVPPFDIQSASYILGHAYSHFPEGTIHIVGINTTASMKAPHVIVKFNNHYFVGADNGIFPLIMGKKHPEKIIEIDILQDSYYFTFSERDVFCKVAVHIAKGNDLEEIGSEINTLQILEQINPIIEKDRIGGCIDYIDKCSNVITNISENDFKIQTKGRKFEIVISPRYVITKISQSYMDVPQYGLVALFNSTGKLEIAQNNGNIAAILNLNIGDPINIYITD